MPRETLSVVVLTKNAEEDIKDCLESAKWADEIVIIDGFSSDSTLGICKSYTTKIIQSEFKSFANERNLGIDNAAGDWILQLDADETVTPRLRDEILNTLNLSSPYVGYKFRRRNYFLGHPMRYGGWYHYSAHFFKRGFGRYEGLVHERLRLNGRQGIIEAEVEHKPFKSIAQFIARQNRYTDYEALEILNSRGILNKRAVLYQMYFKPLKLFWKFYIKKQGFREGFYGLLFSLLYSWINFLKWAKYTELIQRRENKE